MIEAMKQALEALYRIENSLVYSHPVDGDELNAVIESLEKSIAEAEKHKCTYPNCSYPCLDLPDCIDKEKNT